MPPGLPAEARWTLDYPEDYAFFEALFEHLPRGAEGYSMADEGQTLHHSDFSPFMRAVELWPGVGDGVKG